MILKAREGLVAMKKQIKTKSGKPVFITFWVKPSAGNTKAGQTNAQPMDFKVGQVVRIASHERSNLIGKKVRLIATSGKDHFIARIANHKSAIGVKASNLVSIGVKTPEQTAPVSTPNTNTDLVVVATGDKGL